MWGDEIMWNWKNLNHDDYNGIPFIFQISSYLCTKTSCGVAQTNELGFESHNLEKSTILQSGYK